MMTTFMSIMIPRAAVCAERIVEVLDIDAAGRAAGRRRSCPPRSPASSSCAASSTAIRAPTAPVLARHLVHREAGRGHRDHRLDRRGQDHAARSDPAARRSDGGHGARRRRRRPRARARGAVGADRHGAAARVSVLGHGRDRTCGSATPTRPTTSCGPRSRSRRRKDFVARDAAEARRRRSRRAARTSPAASASGSRSRARCCASRRCSCSTIRSRRSTSRPRRGCAPRSHRGSRKRDGDRRRAARREHSPRRIRSSCSTAASSSARARTPSSSRRCPTYAEIVDSQTEQQEAAA